MAAGGYRLLGQLDEPGPREARAVGTAAAREVRRRGERKEPEAGGPFGPVELWWTVGSVADGHRAASDAAAVSYPELPAVAGVLGRGQHRGAPVAPGAGIAAEHHVELLALFSHDR